MGHSHDNKDKKFHSGHNGAHRRWWMMVGCLLLPILLFIVFRGKGGDWGNWIWFLLLGGCILMHAGMMSGHGKRDTSQEEGGGSGLATGKS